MSTSCFPKQRVTSERIIHVATIIAIIAFSVFQIKQANAEIYNDGYTSGFMASRSDVIRPCHLVGGKCSIRAHGRHFRLARAHIRRSLSHSSSRASMTDLIPQLASKVAEIIHACGSKLISGYRPHAVVAGTHHASLHSTYPSKAADLAGNPSCIYAHLTAWAGGYSTDYGRVRHVHMSYSPPGSGPLAGREWHCRFVHGGGSHHRYARHRRQFHA